MHVYRHRYLVGCFSHQNASGSDPGKLGRPDKQAHIGYWVSWTTRVPNLKPQEK